MTRIVSSGLGPTNNSLTYPSRRSSSVSITVSSCEKTLLLVIQTPRLNPNPVSATVNNGRLVLLKIVDLVSLGNDLIKILASFMRLILMIIYMKKRYSNKEHNLIKWKNDNKVGQFLIFCA